MRQWRSLVGGDHVVAEDRAGDRFHATICRVPAEHRDGWGSHFTTSRGGFPKAWIRPQDDPQADPVPWPVDHLHWPGPG